jgi:carbon storage regulator
MGDLVGSRMIARLTGAGGPAMLVITRREGEEVVVGDPANPIGVVRIAAIRGDRVRLAFAFPREIDVHRREVADQILAAKPPVVATIRPAGSEAT